MTMLTKVLVWSRAFIFSELGVFFDLGLLGLLLGSLGLAISEYTLNDDCGVKDHTMGYPTMCSAKPSVHYCLR